MKKLFLSIFLLAAVYTGAWYFLGTQFKDKVEARISAQNENPNYDFKVDYESAKLKGFPLSYEVELLNSILTPKTGKTIPFLSEDLVGNLSIGSNLIASEMWTSMHGESNLNLSLGSMEDPFPLEVNIQNPKLIFTPKDLTETKWPNILNDDFDLTLEFNNFIVKETKTGYLHTIAMSQGQLHLSNQSTVDNGANIHLNFSVDQLKQISEDYSPKSEEEKSLHALISIYAPYFFTHEISSSNLDAIVHIDNFENIADAKNMFAEITFSQTTDKERTGDVNFYLNYEKGSEGDFKIKTKLDTKSHFPKNLLKATIENFEENLPFIEKSYHQYFALNTNAEQHDFGKNIQINQLAAGKDLYKYMYDNFGEDYSAQFDIDIVYAKGESGIPSFNLNIHNYSFSLSPYTFQLNLDVDGTVNLMSPINSLDGKIFFSKHQEQIEHFVNMGNIMIRNKILENDQSPYSITEEISTEKLAKFSSFLTEVSNDPLNTSEDLEISLKGGERGFTIGTKSMQEALMLWMQTFPPKLTP